MEDVFVDEVGASVFDADVYVGELAEEILNIGGQLVEADAVDRGDADGAGDNFSHLHEFAQQFFVSMQDFFGGLVDAFAFSGELELLLASIDEQGCEVLFHRARLLTDC